MNANRIGCLVLSLGLAFDAAAETSDRHDLPLSAAQTALFETPHLQAIFHPETLEYRFQRTGIDPFTDRVAVHIDEIHADGTKSVSFDFLSGERHVFFPAVDNFRGNPLLMIFLEHDVQEMKQQTGVAAAYFRNRMRDAFVDRATIDDSTVELGGRTVQARCITLKPYADDPRFEKLPSVQGKTYRFILSEQVPGELQTLEVDIPADPGQQTQAWSEKVTFGGEKS
jgi:hypothetical protein